MILKPNSAYGVTNDERQVMLHIENRVLHMEWPVALMMASYLRVMTRRAMEYAALTRELPEAEADKERAQFHRAPVHALPEVAHFNVIAEGPSVVLKVDNAQLTMPPEVARNIALWLSNSAREVKAIVAPAVRLQTSVADLTLEHETDKQNQTRRTSTAAFT